MFDIQSLWFEVSSEKIQPSMLAHIYDPYMLMLLNLQLQYKPLELKVDGPMDGPNLYFTEITKLPRWIFGMPFINKY